MAYEIFLRPAAVRALKQIDKQDQARIRGAIALLGVEPRPPGMIPLRGREGFRIRVGNYRIIYTIEDNKLLVVVVALGHRREVYDR